MANVIEKQVYTVGELAQMLGIKQSAMKSVYQELDAGNFPIPAFRIKRVWYFNKKTVHRFLSGKLDNDGEPPTLEEIKNSRFKKEDPAKMTSITFKLRRGLNDKFNRVCTNINMELDKPLNKGDYLRIALEEFIERRPEYKGEEIG